MSGERNRATSMAELARLIGGNFRRENALKSIQSYKPRPTDVIITPYGKSGTTWTQQIFHTLRTRGDMDFDDISRVVPWIETAQVLNIDLNAEQRANPRGFKSHLDYDKVPKGTRYINVIRHPLDVVWSAFKFMEGWYLEPGCVSPDEFARTRAAEADYHKHFVSWWHHREDEDVLYLVYERMKQEPEASIRRIAAFCEIPLDDELLAITREHSSIGFMKQHRDRFDDAMMRKMSEETVLPPGSDSSKVREGQSGEHRWSDEVVTLYDDLWQELVAPETGFDSYESLMASFD